GVGMAMLAAADPAGHETADQVRETGKGTHGFSYLAEAGSFPASSAVRPSSRIFCWKFWRYMPTSSAALVMFAPWRWSACWRKSRSKLSTTRSFASLKVLGRSPSGGCVELPAEVV